MCLTSFISLLAYVIRDFSECSKLASAICFYPWTWWCGMLSAAFVGCGKSRKELIMGHKVDSFQTLSW